MVAINLDGFSLANRLRFAKFVKLSPRQTFPLYGNHFAELYLERMHEFLEIIFKYRRN